VRKASFAMQGSSDCIPTHHPTKSMGVLGTSGNAQYLSHSSFSIHALSDSGMTRYTLDQAPQLVVHLIAIIAPPVLNFDVNLVEL